MADDGRRIVFVLGPGRSGTSTMAGALARSGYHVPNPIAGNETNPLGFYEPRWVVNFHKRILRRIGVRTLDADPRAIARMAPITSSAQERDKLRSWLERNLADHGRLVIKDPRMVWFRDLWVDAAADLGVEPGFVVMLRHPSEVSSSRSNYYNAGEITGVAGWIQVALMTEQLTAGLPRALVRYPDLTADWRTQLVGVRERVGARLEPAPETTPHPVDEFIDPTLRRSTAGWDHVSVPPHLADLGDRAFDLLGEMADHGDSPERSERAEQLREEYALLHESALAIVNARVKRMTLRAARRAVREEREANGTAAATAASDAPAPLLRKVARRLRGPHRSPTQDRAR